MKFSTILISSFLAFSLLSGGETICLKLEGGVGQICFDKQKMLNILQNSNSRSVSKNLVITPTKEKKVITKERVATGEELYKKHCLECHGAKGDLEPYFVSKKLIKMDKDDIIDSVEGYKFNSEGYDKGKALIMYQAVNRLTRDEIEKIADYIEKSLKK